MQITDLLGYRPIGEGSKGQWVNCNWTLLKITRQPFWKRYSWKSSGFCLQPQRTCTWNLKLKFQSKLRVTLPKPCHLQSPETKKSNMATRQPFRKWGHLKSIGSYSYTQVLGHWSFELIFKAKLVRVWKPKNPIWLSGSHFESDIATNQ